MELKKWIAEARAYNNGRGKLTQQQLADLLSVSKQNISAWENGHHEPSWAQILKIASLTGCEPPGGADELARWPFSQDLLARLQALTPDQVTVFENQMRVALGMGVVASAAGPSGKRSLLAA
jgi:DNA-binding XRE family transcriptional regulator